MIITLSLSTRILVNAEALNMAESVGNYTRHRKAPVVFSTGTGYSVVFAPAISGEALAHAYQQILANIAKERGLPVTQLDMQGYFLKFSSTDILDNWYPELKNIINQPSISSWVKSAKTEEIERAFLKASVVADVGGFMLAEKVLKRTSAIRFSYMIPTLDAIESGGTAVIPQLHVRYAPSEMVKEKKDTQALFYVESGSALYTFTSELVASDISKLFYSKTSDKELDEQKIKRVEAAVDALINLVDGFLVGAKRSRYMPLWEIKSIVVTLSKGPVEFIPSPGITPAYVKETYNRAIALVKAIPEETVNIYVYLNEKIDEPILNPEVKNVTYTKVQTHTDALTQAKNKLINILSALQMIQ